MNTCVTNLTPDSRAARTLHRPLLAIGAAVALGAASPALAVTNYSFNPSQTATLVVSNINAVTIQSGDYRFSRFSVKWGFGWQW